MTVESPQIRVLDCLLFRLRQAVSTDTLVRGALYGLELEDGTKVVLAAAGQEASMEEELELINGMLPCGVEPMGVFGLGKGAVSGLGPLLDKLPPITQPTESPVLLWVTEEDVECRLGDEEVSIVNITREELSQLVTLVRIKGQVELNAGFSVEEVGAAFRHLIEKVSCPYGSFVLEGGRLVFLHKFLEGKPGKGWTSLEEQKDVEDCLIIGADKEGLLIEQLWEFTEKLEEDDGWGNKNIKKKKVEPRDRLEMEFVWNYSNPACSSRTIGCAPLVHREVKPASTIKLPINLDALGVISNKAPASNLMEVMKGAVGRQVGDIASAVLSQLKMKGTITTPEVFHYYPDLLGHHLTIVYPKNTDNDQFEAFRRTVHTNFLLPLDRPLLRRANRTRWSQTDSNTRLSNVHRGIEGKHGVGSCADVALVQGDYQYHHYMQDSFDDDGWGCAYRSLQTLSSWLGLQGYTDTEVPSHTDIQKVLVDIGDKEAKFIGSKQWIGSTEVGFVLETRCGVESRFVSVSAGSDLSSKARELLIHFQTQGSPVMIGGGVYAHTILGIAWDQASGDCSWLVLDPHYTGSEDLKTILGKGWCGWKGPNFWNQTAFYNMCLPQRPKDVI